MNEVLSVLKTSRRVFHSLDLGIDRFADRVRDPMRRYVMMFSERRLSIRSTSIIGCSRLRTAQLCHEQKRFLAGRS
jgi:hypothetical protein